MPIRRREFEAGSTAHHPVLEFLTARSDEAFTLSEIATALGESGLSGDDIDAALRSLEAEETIEAKVVGNRVYYRYRVPLGYLRG